MIEASDFAGRAKGLEVLAASIENSPVQVTLQLPARDYWALAAQENNQPTSEPTQQPVAKLLQY
jgi:hypothetical protein